MSRLLRGTTLLILVTLVAGITGCSVNPVTGKKELSLLSPAQEVAMGSKQYGPAQQSQGGTYTVDPDLTFYVNSVGKKLARVSDQPNLPYEFVVLNNGVPNAWALPGGKIAINRGLLTELDDEAQLAAVLGHEIVHAAARHSAQQMTKGTLLSVGAQVATMAAQNSEYGQLVGMGSQLGSQMYMAHYGRDQELQADHYGMLYMSRAGYDPQAAVELQQTFVRLSQGRNPSWVEGLFASHPPSSARVSANQAMAAELKASTGRSGVRNKAAFDKAMRQLSKDAAAYELEEQAQKAAEQKNWAQAQSLARKAIAKQPNEPSFYLTQADAQMQQKQYSAAFASFQKAHKLYPEYFLPLLGKGISAMQLKRYAIAEQSLLQSAKILPTQAASFYLGEANLAQGDRAQAIQWFQQAQQGGGTLGQQSSVYLEKLQQGR